MKKFLSIKTVYLVVIITLLFTQCGRYGKLYKQNDIQTEQEKMKNINENSDEDIQVYDYDF